MMLDLSVAGAKLKVDPGTELPQQFILVMSRDGTLNRRCQTMWRDQDTLGVQFLTRKSIGPKQEETVRRFTIQLPPDDELDLPGVTLDADGSKGAASR